MPIKILTVIPTYWPEGGGGTLATYLLVKLLSLTNDFEITVLTATRNPAKVRNVKYIIDPLLGVINKRIPSYPLRPIAIRYENIIRKYDVIYIVYAYTLIPIAKKLGKKTITHLHDYAIVSPSSMVLPNSSRNSWELVKESFRIKYLEGQAIGRLAKNIFPSIQILTLIRRWILMSDVVVAVSRRQAEILTGVIPELTDKLRVIYNLLPEVPYIPKQLGDPTFLYLGGGSYVKGFHVLLGAGWRILKRHPDAKIFLTKSFKGSKRVLLEKLNKLFNGAFKLLGHLDYNDVLRLHSISYALLFPSIWEEPLPYAAVESMLAGTIPVASRVGGVPEIVEGTPAEKLMFTPGDVDELVDRIELVFSMSKEQLTDAGYRLRDATLRKFNEERVRRELLRVFTV